MATEIELNPIDFITVGTIGPKGQRTFHLQAGKDSRVISFTIEKEQAWALSEAIKELLDDIDEREGTTTEADFSHLDMDLREPIEPLFRIAQMALAYEERAKMVILVAHELVPNTQNPFGIEEEDDGEGDEDLEPSEDSNIVRMWCTREQMRALSLHAIDTVKAGRPDAKQNGRIIYYWT